MQTHVCVQSKGSFLSSERRKTAKTTSQSRGCTIKTHSPWVHQRQRQFHYTRIHLSSVPSDARVIRNAWNALRHAIKVSPSSPRARAATAVDYWNYLWVTPIHEILHGGFKRRVSLSSSARGKQNCLVDGWSRREKLNLLIPRGGARRQKKTR